MSSEQHFITPVPRSHDGPARPAWRTSRCAVALVAVLMAGLAAGPVSAQSPQPETPPTLPGVPPGNTPRAEGPAQATPDPDMSEEDDDGGEGCPYLGQPLELVV